MEAYKKLSVLYDKDWGNFSTLYLKLIFHAMEEYKFNPSSVLDVACGTGKLVSELYKQNFTVEGLDISQDMINVARKNNPGIKFHIDDMTSFDLERKFDLITCAFDSLNYLLEDKQVRNALSDIYSHLNDNGLFIFDINTPVLYEEKHFGVIERKYDDISFRQILEYNKETRLGKTTFDFGQGEQELHVQKAYTSDEMDNFLMHTGFRILKRYKDFKFSPVDEKAYKIFYIVKKDKA